jgi:hypothetical protein
VELRAGASRQTLGATPGENGAESAEDANKIFADIRAEMQTRYGAAAGKGR